MLCISVSVIFIYGISGLEDLVVTVQKFGIEVLKPDGKVHWILNVDYGLKLVINSQFVSVDQTYRFCKKKYGKISGFDTKY